MKKLTIILALMLAFAGYSHSQVIEDFEHIPLNIMLGGEEDNSTMTVIANPDQGEANPSPYVVEFYRSQHGLVWGGFWSALPEPVDMTNMKYVHVQVWKPRISPIKFKVEGGPGGTFELESMEPQTLTEEWETITFHFPDADGLYPIIVFMPDFEDPLELDEDIVIYLDNIVFSNNELPGEGNEMVIEHFDPIPMNIMLGGEADDSYFDVVLNPDQNEANPSHRVGKYFRSQHGVPWGGFWSALPMPFDMSEHKYVYVDVWKPRISPVKFKVEGGPGGTFELESMEPQTKVNEWETLVFHFPEAYGNYPVIAFMPDFEDPLELTEDIIIYFDNIRLGGAPDAEDDYYQLALFVDPIESGNVIGAGSYQQGDTVSISAVSADGFQFVNWTNTLGNIVSQQPNFTLIMPDYDISLTANFELIDYNVTLAVAPEEAGTVTGHGTYNMGDMVTLTTTANTGYEFISWTNENEVEVSNDLTFVFVMPPNNVSLTANYIKKIHTLNISIMGQGQVKVNGEYYTQPLEFDYGTNVTLEALPDNGWQFDYWKDEFGDTLSSASSWIFIMPAQNSTLTAVMVSDDATALDEPNKPQVTVYPNPAMDKVYFISVHPIEYIRIYSTSGQVVMKEYPAGETQFSIDIEHLLNGMYIVELQSAHFQQQIKLLVK